MIVRAVPVQRFVLSILLVALAGSARADGDAVRGKAKFVDCAACHSVDRGVNGVGPSLSGVVGRKAGAIEDYRYSPAMARSGITWTPAALDQYIADPQMKVPGNRMPYAGMPNAADRADLIAYLQTLK
jgi:cytochrome c